jgi:predicted Zn-dependent peptidase
MAVESPAPRKVATVEGITEYQFDNGLRALLFPDNSQSKVTVNLTVLVTIGNRSDIERVPIENLQTFYKKYYQPDNVVLIVAGKFDEAKALALIIKDFGSIPRPTRKLDKTWTEEPPQDGERLVTLRRVGDVSAVGLAYHIPAGSHEENASLQVLANILSTRPSGRLYKALVETKKASSASAFAGRDLSPELTRSLEATLALTARRFDGPTADGRSTLRKSARCIPSANHNSIQWPS